MYVGFLLFWLIRTSPNLPSLQQTTHWTHSTKLRACNIYKSVSAHLGYTWVCSGETGEAPCSIPTSHPGLWYSIWVSASYLGHFQLHQLILTTRMITVLLSCLNVTSGSGHFHNRVMLKVTYCIYISWRDRNTRIDWLLDWIILMSRFSTCRLYRVRHKPTNGIHCTLFLW